MTIKKNFNKYLLRELSYLEKDESFVLEDTDQDTEWGNPGDKFWCESTERLDDRRWSANYCQIFGFQAAPTEDVKFYQTFYSVGLTEYQDESPYEWEDKLVSCEEVEKSVRTVTQEVVEWKVKE